MVDVGNVVTMLATFGGGGNGGVRASGRGRVDGGGRAAPLEGSGGVRARDLEEESGGGGVCGPAAAAAGSLAGGPFALGFKLEEAALPLVSGPEVAKFDNCGGL